MREAKRQGQIKGPARRALGSQSARGFAAAPRGVLRVPRGHRNPHANRLCRVPFALGCVTLRQRHRHGIS